MDEFRLASLEKSIAKWEKNAQITDPREILIGLHNCPLCQLFIDLECEGCPVYAKTGEKYCYETPYTEIARQIIHIDDRPMGVTLEKLKSMCQDEVDFLKSLLPAGE